MKLSWHQFRRFTPYLLGIALCAVSQSALAATYWQIQQPDVAVIVEGDKDRAKNFASMAFRLRSAARWLLNWPISYREPPVLVFSVNERLLRRTFTFPPTPIGANTDANTGHGSWVRTPSLTVVAVPTSYQGGYELRPLQLMYADALLDGAPSHDWPACAHIGMPMLFAAAEITAPNHFHLSAEKMFLFGHTWNPDQFLIPPNGPREPLPQYSHDEWGYSCYILSYMIASATPEQRNGLERMLAAVGRGMPLGAATLSELQQTLPEFTSRYREFSRSLKSSIVQHDIWVDFPEAVPAISEPTPITPQELQELLKRLCSKINNCRK